jgi:hypothetical protein
MMLAMAFFLRMAAMAALRKKGVALASDAVSCFT